MSLSQDMFPLLDIEQPEDTDDDQEMIIFSAIDGPAEQILSPVERAKNFPPLPKRCCFKPCFYQNIEDEIPIELRDTVRSLFKFWFFHIIINFFNVCGGIFMADPIIFGLGMFYLFLFAILSYVCWFRSAYNAFSARNSSMNLLIFFVVSLLQLIIEILQTIGVDSFGTVGILTVIGKWGNNLTILNIFNMFISFAFGFGALGDIYFIIQVYIIYRASPISLNQAQNELKAIFFIHK